MNKASFRIVFAVIVMAFCVHSIWRDVISIRIQVWEKRLLRAVNSDDAAGVRRALAEGASINLNNDAGEHLVHATHARGQLQIFRILLQQDQGIGYDTSEQARKQNLFRDLLRDGDGQFLEAYLAARREVNETELIEWLATSDISTDDPRLQVLNTQRPAMYKGLLPKTLRYAVAYLSPAAVDDVLKHKVRLADWPQGKCCFSPQSSMHRNRPDTVRSPVARELGLLQTAAARQKGSVPMLKYLLGKGIDINSRDVDGKTALMWAALTRNSRAMNFLILKGADVAAVDFDGRNVLMYMLLDHGTVNIDRRGWMSFGVDKFRFHYSLVSRLQDAGLDIHARDVNGNTALSYAKFLKLDDAVSIIKYVATERRRGPKAVSP